MILSFYNVADGRVLTKVTTKYFDYLLLYIIKQIW